MSINYERRLNKAKQQIEYLKNYIKRKDIQFSPDFDAVLLFIAIMSVFNYAAIIFLIFK